MGAPAWVVEAQRTLGTTPAEQAKEQRAAAAKERLTNAIAHTKKAAAELWFRDGQDWYAMGMDELLRAATLVVSA